VQAVSKKAEADAARIILCMEVPSK
jgi:hypothetical protein